MDARQVFDKGQRAVAQIGGQFFSVGRPDYTVSDGTPQEIFPSVKLKAEPTNSRLPHARIINVDYYAVFGNRAYFKPGDIITAQEGNSTTPPLTILSYSPMEECIAIRTQRSCTIKIGNTPLFTNVRFDWVGVGFAGSGLKEALSGALSVPTKRAIFYTRPSLTPQTSLDDMVGMHLVEDDGGVDGASYRWTIKLVDQIGNLTVVTLEEDGAHP